MPKSVLSIEATGTRGKVRGKLFKAEASIRGYPLHSLDLASRSGKPLRFAINREYAATLDEAARWLQAGTHHIRLYNREHKQFNLREPGAVDIVMGP